MHRAKSVLGRAPSRPAAVFVIALLVSISCGGSPTEPGPPTGRLPNNQPPSANLPPVIDSISISADRAEVDTDVTVTATVRDAETPVEQLRYDWKADVGVFSGQGATVRWRAPRGTSTPADVTLRLTVTETYGSADGGGARPQHAVEGTSPAVRLHDSRKEVTDLALAFLRDFSDSSVSPEAAVRHFADSCSGKQAELEDLRKNREHYVISASTYSVSSVNVDSSRARGDVTAPCEFTSRVVKCHPEVPNCRVGMTVSVRGVCALQARYESRRWWLCDSRFNAANGFVPYGFAR